MVLGTEVYPSFSIATRTLRNTLDGVPVQCKSNTHLTFKLFAYLTVLSIVFQKEIHNNVSINYVYNK